MIKKLPLESSFLLAFMMTLSLSVNSVQAFDKIVLNSDFSTGLTQTNVYQIVNSNELIVNSNGFAKLVQGEQAERKLQSSKMLSLSLLRNGKESNFYFDLSKGNNIVIDGCKSKLVANQYKNKLYFE